MKKIIAFILLLLLALSPIGFAWFTFTDGGGGSGTITASTAGYVAVYSAATSITGFSSLVFNSGTGQLSATSISTTASNTPQTNYTTTQDGDTQFLQGTVADGGDDDDDYHVIAEGSDLVTSRRFIVYAKAILGGKFIFLTNESSFGLSYINHGLVINASEQGSASTDVFDMRGNNTYSLLYCDPSVDACGMYTTSLTARWMVSPPSTEVIAGAATITANACGTIKPISAGSSVTTNTTNTFTAPATANSGCIMDVINVDDTDTITLDNNANFVSAGAADVALGPGDTVRVASNGSKWYQVGATGNN